MDDKKRLNHRLARMAWGALLIWWGVVVMIDALTVGIAAVGTGLILIGVNAVRSLKGIPVKRGNNVVGAILIVWGLLDQARYLLSLPSGLSLALMLIVTGLTLLLTPLLPHPNLQAMDNPGDV